jgi:hypothetical protein
MNINIIKIKKDSDNLNKKILNLKKDYENFLDLKKEFLKEIDNFKNKYGEEELRNIDLDIQYLNKTFNFFDNQNKLIKYLDSLDQFDPNNSLLDEENLINNNLKNLLENS